MRRHGSWATLAVLMVASCLAFISLPAHAAEDSITNLVVHYDIQDDGSVLVEHRMDWRFASDGRHGIDFSIVTRETWEGDEDKDVVYDVSNIRVDSPSGAPDEFTERTAGLGSGGRIELRIGDPDVTIEGREATYVVSYELRGALRTFDGTPEFFWDVTSTDNPEIQQFEVRVTAPDGVARARCLVGSSECNATASAQGAVFSGGSIAKRTVLSVVAGLPPGSVTGAEPQVEDRRVASEELRKMVSDVEVSSTGVLHVDQELTYRLPHDYTEYVPSVSIDIPLRRPFSADEDRLYEITNVEVEGAAAVEVRGPDAYERDKSSQDLTVKVTFEQVSDTAVVVLSYDVTGAVVTDEDASRVSWIIASMDAHHDPVVDFTWGFPGPVHQAVCNRFDRQYSEEPRQCDPELRITDDAVVWRPSGGNPSLDARMWLTAEIDPLTGRGSQPVLEPGLDAAARRTERLTLVGAVSAALLFGALTITAATATLRKSSRWGDVPPGVTAGAGSRTRRARRSDIVPVRFHEPEASLWLAGLVLDQRPDTRHTVAVLVRLATLGALELRSSPVQVTRRPDVTPEDSLEAHLCNIADSDSHAPVVLQRMNQAVADEQDTLLKNRARFQEPRPSMRVRRLLVWTPLLVSAVWFAVFEIFSLDWLGPYGRFIAVGAFVGALVAGFIARRVPQRTPLAPAGTALKDQVEGFRTYIATAEAHQLNVEADADVYRRYLPWAVLFDLVERWSTLCQDMVDAGRIPPLDMSFLGSDSPMGVAAGVASLGTRVPPATSSSTLASSSVLADGGSAGSSGFSGDSSGGGGGGGTSSSSW